VTAAERVIDTCVVLVVTVAIVNVPVPDTATQAGAFDHVCPNPTAQVDFELPPQAITIA